MPLALVARLFHVLAAFWLIGGVAGRTLSFREAGRAADVDVAYHLHRLSDRFDGMMVIPGSHALLLFGLLAAWLGGWPLLGFLQGAERNWLFASLVLYLCLLVLVVAVAIPRRKRRNRAAEEAKRQGAITPEFAAALRDRVLRRSRIAEAAIAITILVLMVTKPF